MNGRKYDAIVIGSGIGGLAAAAALAKCGRRVLVVERHFQLGGLTQTFKRGHYTFAAGVHYIAGVGDEPGPENQFGRLLRWATDGRLRFASVGSPYDIVRLPGLEFPIEAPRAAYVDRLKRTFPGESVAIDRYFAACAEALRADAALFASLTMPAPIAFVTRLLSAKRIQRMLAPTAAAAVQDVRDPLLGALLFARWGDYGMPPAQSPFAIHALVMSAYFSGAYYPVGGPARFADTLGETIRRAGGDLRTRTAVAEIRVAGSRVAGVRLADDEQIDAPVVVSAMGARNTIAALPAGAAPAWRDHIGSLKSGISHVGLYVGFHGDIRARGATSANVWVHESIDIGRVWERPGDEAPPGLFVNFASLKDPAHAYPECHTAEVICNCRWEPFAAWSSSAPEHRPKEYEKIKARIGEHLLALFTKHFPQLAPLIDFHEVSTPLSQASYVAAHHGAMYGLEMSAERLSHPTLGVRTPVRGLLLAGQDALSLGVPGAFMGGFMAAASVEPRLWKQTR